MRYWTCECRKSEWFGSDSPPYCSKCSSCGTNHLKTKPNPHDFSNATKVQTDEGEKPLTLCKFCYHTKAQIEKLGE